MNKTAIPLAIHALRNSSHLAAAAVAFGVPGLSFPPSAGDPSFLESVDIYYDQAAKLSSVSPDILAQIKVLTSCTGAPAPCIAIMTSQPAGRSLILHVAKWP